mgnify:FL=1
MNRIIPARAGFTPLTEEADRGERWIIPARAGFTSSWARRGRRCTDHPRSRGVYAAADIIKTSQQGSSPLARGLPERSQRPQPSCRIIPARAGFTGAAFTTLTLPRDHPRSRGVYQL